MDPELFRYLSLSAIAVIGTSIAIIGFLLRSTFTQLLKATEDLKASMRSSREEIHKELSELKEVLRDMKADLRALDTTDRQQGREILELTVQYKYLQEYAHTLKDEMKRLHDRFEEFGKFLSWKLGFKRSADPKPEDGEPG